MIPYQAEMLPQVDYQKIEENCSFSLSYLEHQTMQDCCDFLEILKSALIAENLMQAPELLVAHLCAYLGTAATVHTVKKAKKLELPIVDLIKHQADVAYQHFNKYPINSTVKSDAQKKANVIMLRESAPGSIVAQTMRLGRVVMDVMEDLAQHYQGQRKSTRQPKQSDLFCSQDMLIKIMLLTSSKKCAEWREQLDGLSDNYVINQLAIQIGWLIGYFSHLDKQSPDKTQYLDYGLPLILLYRKYIFKMMESYAGAVHAQEAEKEESKNREAEKLLNEIHVLAEKTNAQRSPATRDFQKQILKANAEIEEILMELMMQKYSIKIMLMSLFYFWFTLEAPLNTNDLDAIKNQDALSHMGTVIDIIKNTVRSLPNPSFTPEIKALNEKMQLLKPHLPHPEMLDKEVPKNVEQQTAHINTAIHTAMSEMLKQNVHLEAVATALFNHWMRLSVFFGVSESDWQKMDYYFADIMEAVRSYLRSI